jgi:FAD/FMN-containing dehydrogenase
MNLDALKSTLGVGGYIDEPTDMAPFLTEWRDRWRGRTPLVARPDTVEKVAALLAFCNAARIPVVPQGGHTGLCGGAMPDESNTQIVLSLGRMNRFRSVDADAFTMTVEAGCILADIQVAAEEADRLFPLSLASEGSAQLGGVLSTNAGGNTVLRYGNARDLVLGLEVVLPDGRIWNGLRGLLKDNTGYDLKHLFMGAEGTLGVITAAVLKLFPRPAQQATALLSLPNATAAVKLLSIARRQAGDDLTSLELMPRRGLEFVVRHMPGCRDPFASPYPFYVLMELSSTHTNHSLQDDLETIFTEAAEHGLAADGIVARSEAQRQDLWRLRESMSEAQKFEGGSIKHDISVSISAIPEFLKRAIAAVESLIPGIRPVPFGHIGDGNIHFNLSQPEDADKDAFLARWEEVNGVVHDIVAELNGSISAEHGIGQLKVDEISRYKPAVEIELMEQIKHVIDPNEIMNPGKVLP